MPARSRMALPKRSVLLLVGDGVVHEPGERPGPVPWSAGAEEQPLGAHLLGDVLNGQASDRRVEV